MGAGMIRILLVDDNAEYRGRLAKLLGLQKGVEVVGQAADGREGIELARALRPNVILIDFRMAGLDGFSAARAMVRDLPDTKVFILTAYPGALDATKVQSRGVHGLLIKDQPIAEIIEAIRQVSAA